MALKRESHFEKELTSRDSLIGLVVDDSITEILRRAKRGQPWPQKFEKGIRILLDQYVEQTKQWKTDHEAGVSEPIRPRRMPVSDWFWGDEPTDQELDEIVAEANKLVEAWNQSEIPQWISSHPVENWKLRPPPSDEASFEDRFPCVQVDGLNVYAVYDFGIHSPEYTCIVDWKTGKISARSEDDATRQVLVYGKYAEVNWGAKPENIELKLVWLAAGAEHCVQTIPYDPVEATKVIEEYRGIRDLIMAKMKSAGYENEEGTLREFPITPWADRCKWCNFRSCEGYPRHLSGETSQPE